MPSGSPSCRIFTWPRALSRRRRRSTSSIRTHSSSSTAPALLKPSDVRAMWESWTNSASSAGSTRLSFSAKAIPRMPRRRHQGRQHLYSPARYSKDGHRLTLERQRHVQTIEEWSMYRHILIPTDGSELAEHGVTNGLALAKSLGAKVSVIVVEEPFDWHRFSEITKRPPEEFRRYAEQSKQDAKSVLDRTANAAKQAGVAC